MSHTYTAQSNFPINFSNAHICISKNISIRNTVSVSCFVLPVYHSFIGLVTVIFFFIVHLSFNRNNFFVETNYDSLPREHILKNVLIKIIIIDICYLLFNEI